MIFPLCGPKPRSFKVLCAYYTVRNAGSPQLPQLTIARFSSFSLYYRQKEEEMRKVFIFFFFKLSLVVFIFSWSASHCVQLCVFVSRNFSILFVVQVIFHACCPDSTTCILRVVAFDYITYIFILINSCLLCACFLLEIAQWTNRWSGKNQCQEVNCGVRRTTVLVTWFGCLS